ncbi:MAG: hypothetical protein ACKO8U_14845 [Pirellula sp.]
MALAQAALVQADQVATEVQAVPVALEVLVNHPDPAARAQAAIAAVHVTTSGTVLAGIL